MSRSDFAVLTVSLPADLVARAEAKAAREGRSRDSVFEEGLRQAIGEGPPSQRPDDATQPSLELLQPFSPEWFHALQEDEDLDYVRRMNEGFR